MSEQNQLIADRYLLVKQLGSGGMGVVWQAYDERLHRTVAVKQLMLPSILTMPEVEQAKERAMREGRLAAKLQHPNVISVYDVAEHHGHPYLIMEYLPSRSLSEVLAERGSLPPREVATIGAQAANALASAHEAGVVHRDVKPGNVLLADDGTVKITDFGISRAVEDVTITLTGVIAGTPAYLAPEVARGQPATFSSDVFSLGSTLYAAVEGSPPFGHNDNAMALLHRVASASITPPSQAGPMTSLLFQLLRDDPDQRPTMAQVSEALADLAGSGDGRRALPPTAAYTAATGRGGSSTKSLPAAGGHSGGGGAGFAAGAQAGAGTRHESPARSAAAPSVAPAAAAARSAVAAQSGPAAPPAIPPAPPGGKSPTTGTEGGGRRTAVAIAAAIALLALFGVLLTVTVNRDGQDSGTALPQASSAAQSTASAAPTTPANRPSPTTAVTPTAAPTPVQTPAPSTVPPATPPANNPQTMQAAVSGYYALIPGNLREGWTRLTARYQRRAGGFAGYQNFWNQMQSVRASEVTAGQGNVVEATVEYSYKSGRTVLERHAYAMVNQDGRWLLDDHTVLSSRTI